jgi:ATP-dependent helicase HrpB
LYPWLLDALPIDAHVPRIVALARERRAVVVTAAPGAGKTTRVPPALTDGGPVLLLQPRRVAARAIARRIASERGWTIGREVGWHVRFERKFTGDTQLLVATEGILTARLQEDPLLTGFGTVVLDEFHERSIHADLGLALAREAWRSRADLRLVVMSATIDADRVAAFLGDCPVVQVEGRTFPVEVRYDPTSVPERAITAALPAARGAILCFLPGAPEIRRTAEKLAQLPALSGVTVLPLHGGLDADAQDAAIDARPQVRPQVRPRVILATNIAETTITVPDVVTVIDTGLVKVARYDPHRLIDSLETERVSQDSAEQRAGRAGRTGPGLAIRLWDSRDRLRPHAEPEIARVDLASVALDILAWGGDPATFPFFEAPSEDAMGRALELLTRLGAIDGRRHLLPIGRDLARLPLHPRLGRILIAARGASAAARACALLSERHAIAPRHGATACDLLSAVDDERALPSHVVRIARDLRETFARSGRAADAIGDEAFRKAVLAGYPDRLARRREKGGDKFLLASGTGARLARESGVHDAEFIVAVDVTAGTGPPGSATADALIRLATGIEREWLEPTSVETRHYLDDTGRARAERIDMYDQLALARRPVAVDAAAAGELVIAEYLRRGQTDDDRAFLRRAVFAGIDASFETLVREAGRAAASLDDVAIASALTTAQQRALASAAPSTIPTPKGRDVRLEYRDDGGVGASVRLQDLFGLRTTPLIGPRKVPVTFSLLSPGGKPVQITSDLASFWSNTYPDVRRQLRLRYPKHKWPENPTDN